MADEMTFGSAGALLVRKLIQARKERGLSFEEVTVETRIKKDHLEKIEAGDLTFLPAAYVYAFLKEYAGAVGVDDSELLERCRDELSIPSDLKVRQEAAEEEEERGSQKGERLSGMFSAVTSSGGKISPVTLVGGAVFIVLVLLIVAFFTFSGSQGIKGTAPQAESEPAVIPDEVQHEVEIMVPDSVVLADTDTLSGNVPGETSELAVKQEDWAKDVSFLPESSTSPYQKVLIVRVIKDLSWVKIVADDGDREYPGGQFGEGDVLRYEAKKKFWVNIGRPPLVELYLNGEKVPPMSKRTIVLGEEESPPPAL